MADDLHYDVFENEIDVTQQTQNNEVDDNYEHDFDGSNNTIEDINRNNDPIKQQKLLKRKAMFDKMKVKKINKQGNHGDNEEDTETSNQQKHALITNAPEEFKTSMLSLADDCFADVSNISSEHCAFSNVILRVLPQFQHEMNVIPPEKGCPSVIIVCSSAIRSVAVIHSISKIFSCKIGKLFAKHFKVHEQVEALQKHFPIVVGTPNRLNKLIELGALSMTRTCLVLIDLAEDTKKFHILNHPSICPDVYEWLSSHVAPIQSQLKIGLI